MNASVAVSIDSKENILMIPVDALIEKEDGVYVYTSYEEKTESFGGLIKVTTGVSDGKNVEILSGLEEGDEFWYCSYDKVNYSTYSNSGNGGLGFPSMMGGGRPGGR